jgi:hypothetical protein
MSAFGGKADIHSRVVVTHITALMRNDVVTALLSGPFWGSL